MSAKTTTRTRKAAAAASEASAEESTARPRTRIPPQPWSRPGGMAETDPFAPDSVAVYRFYNVPGALLYVGITGNPKLRFGQHLGDKRWWQDVAHWTVDWYPDRTAADAEETRAIREEVPAYNIAKVPAVDDERDPGAEWLATFRRRPPHKVDLDELFLALVRFRSLKHDSTARHVWTERKALDIYVYAKDHAKRVDVHEHQQFIDRWNVEQEAAWRKHHGEPEPDLVPDWPRPEGLRERLALWLLGRSVPRPRPRFRSRAEIKNRERAAETRVRCTATGVLVSVCDCHGLHIVDADDEARYGLPLGAPIRPKSSKAKKKAKT